MTGGIPGCTVEDPAVIQCTVEERGKACGKARRWHSTSSRAGGWSAHKRRVMKSTATILPSVGTSQGFDSPRRHHQAVVVKWLSSV